MLLWLALGAATGPPTIGVLAQPTPKELASQGTSFIPASYVKWVEQAGAVVVPLQFDLAADELEARFRSVNGLLFPGGDASINDGSAFATVSRRLFEKAVAEDVPVFGTCMGFEQLILYSSSVQPGQGIRPTLQPVDAEALFLPLQLKGPANASRLLGPAPPHVVQTLVSRNSTVNLHAEGLLLADVAKDPALAGWAVLATGFDRRGQEFVALAEKGNLFAAQFHPEKNAFEHYQAWEGPATAEMHSPDAIEASAWFSRAFVSAAAKTGRSFPSHKAFTDVSIWRFAPVYTNRELPGQNVWEQSYVFPASTVVI